MAKVIIIEPDITEEENQRRWNIVKEILHEIDKEIVRENTEVNNWKTGWIAFKNIQEVVSSSLIAGANSQMRI